MELVVVQGIWNGDVKTGYSALQAFTDLAKAAGSAGSVSLTEMTYQQAKGNFSQGLHDPIPGKQKSAFVPFDSAMGMATVSICWNCAGVWRQVPCQRRKLLLWSRLPREYDCLYVDVCVSMCACVCVCVQAGVEAILAAVRTIPNAAGSHSAVYLNHMGGAINAVPVNATSFPHRTYVANFVIDSHWESPVDITNQVRRLTPASGNAHATLSLQPQWLSCCMCVRGPHS